MEPLVGDMEDYIRLMLEYNNKFWLLINLPLYQCILNLTGRSRNILDSAETMKYRSKLGWENRTGEETDWSYRMQIAFYAEDFLLATDLANKLMAIKPGQARTFPYYQTRVFFFVLVALWNAKHYATSRLRRRKYIMIAKKYYTMIKGWVVKKKAINMAHKLRILNAEMKSLKRNVDLRALMLAYDDAISSSSRSGFLNDAALAAHLASRSPIGDDDGGKTRLLYYERALELYDSWGAAGLVDILHDNSTGGLSSSMVSRSFSSRHQGSRQRSSDSHHLGFRSRPRYDKRLSQQHKEITDVQRRLQKVDDHTE